MNNIKIKTKNLNFYYGKNQVLKNINIDILKNCVTAFIGHSGSGKSTLIRTFNKIYSLYPENKVNGEIYLYDVNILNPKENLILLRKRVGMVFQKPTPFPMTNYENIAFGVRLYEKLSSQEMDNRVEWSFTKAGIWDEVKDKLKVSSLHLSQGQQQRLCIARAIAVKPEVLLLDEPTASLDPKSSSIIEELVLELKNDYTIVIVTHNLKQAKKTADYSAHIDHGQLIEYDKTDVVFSYPQNPITKKYIDYQ
jgi:phosphate transport system ATP-binding protein